MERMKPTPCPVCGSSDIVRAEPTCVGRIDVWSDKWLCRTCDGRWPERLMGLGVLDRSDGRPPVPFLEALLEPGWEHGEPSGIRLRLRSAAAERQVDDEEDPDLLLDVIGSPATTDTEDVCSVTCRSNSGDVVQHLLRPVLSSDAAWLSTYGLAALPSIDMIRELAERRAAGRDTTEQVAALSLPRMAPHAIIHRIGRGPDGLIWLRLDGRWHRCDASSSVPLTERMSEVAREARLRPWLIEHLGTAELADARLLLEGDLWSLPLQPWGIQSAISRIARPVAQHDELAFVLLASEADTVVASESLGPALTQSLIMIADHVSAAVAARGWLLAVGGADFYVVSNSQAAPQGPRALFAEGSDSERLLQLVDIRKDGFRARVGELIEVFDLYDEHQESLADVISAAQSLEAWSGDDLALFSRGGATL